jgi:RNA polymerase sigma-70 factor (ECF subfamily)
VGAERPRVPRQRQSPDAQVDSAAFEQDALALVDRLYAAALRLTRNEADAQDLVQDTYLRAFRSSGQFAAGTNLRGWMFTILHNAFLNQRRDRGRSPIDADSDAVEQAPDDRQTARNPEELLLRETLDADLQAALDSLPAAYREAVWLRDVEQFSYQEIARIVGVPVGTVMSRIARGRRALYEDLVARSGAYARRAGGESRRRGV